MGVAYLICATPEIFITMLKKILKILAALVFVAVLSFALVAIYSFSTVKIMRSGLDAIVGKDADIFFERSKEKQSASQMRLVWIDKNLGKAAFLLEGISKREKPSIFPSINSRDNFALSGGGETLKLSNPSLAVPLFFVGDLSKSFGDGFLCEFACVIFDIPDGKSDWLLKILSAKGDAFGNFEGSDLRFENSPAEPKLAEDRSFFDDLILRSYFKLNASESSSAASFISDVWKNCDAKKAAGLSWGLQIKYFEFIFGSSSRMFYSKMLL